MWIAAFRNGLCASLRVAGMTVMKWLVEKTVEAGNEPASAFGKEKT
jgi:hypothetical protein